MKFIRPLQLNHLAIPRRRLAALALAIGLPVIFAGGALADTTTYFYTCPSSGSFVLSQKADAKKTVDILCISDAQTAGGVKTAAPQSQSAASDSTSSVVVTCAKKIVLKAISGAEQYSCSDGAVPTIALTVASATAPTNNPAAVPDPALTGAGDGGGLFQNYLNPFINFLTVIVGIVAVISIIVGGIQYSTAGGDSQKVSAARNRIRNAVIGMVAFLLLWAFLQWLIPGGIGG